MVHRVAPSVDAHVFVYGNLNVIFSYGFDRFSSTDVPLFIHHTNSVDSAQKNVCLFCSSHNPVHVQLNFDNNLCSDTSICG